MGTTFTMALSGFVCKCKNKLKKRRGRSRGDGQTQGRFMNIPLTPLIRKSSHDESSVDSLGKKETDYTSTPRRQCFGSTEIPSVFITPPSDESLLSVSPYGNKSSRHVVEVPRLEDQTTGGLRPPKNEYQRVMLGSPELRMGMNRSRAKSAENANRPSEVRSAAEDGRPMRVENRKASPRDDEERRTHENILHPSLRRFFLFGF